MVSASATATLKIANVQLFGLSSFGMKLPKYKIDLAARHHVWLTVLLQNIPQIIISCLYAQSLSGNSFNIVTVFALMSSTISLTLTVISLLSNYRNPKYYYNYKMILKMDQRNKLTTERESEYVLNL